MEKTVESMKKMNIWYEKAVSRFNEEFTCIDNSIQMHILLCREVNHKDSVNRYGAIIDVHGQEVRPQHCGSHFQLLIG